MVKTRVSIEKKKLQNVDKLDLLLQSIPLRVLSEFGMQGQVPTLFKISLGLMLSEVLCAEMAILMGPDNYTIPCSSRAKRRGLEILLDTCY